MHAQFKKRCMARIRHRIAVSRGPNPVHHPPLHTSKDKCTRVSCQFISRHISIGAAFLLRVVCTKYGSLFAKKSIHIAISLFEIIHPFNRNTGGVRCELISVDGLTK
jgi:hypothetical protein